MIQLRAKDQLDMPKLEVLNKISRRVQKMLAHEITNERLKNIKGGLL